MAFITGSGTTIQFGKESGFAISANPTTLINHTNEGISVSVSKGDEGSLLVSKTPSSRDLLSIGVDGSISFILRPEFAGLLFNLALGGNDNCSQIDESEWYKHNFCLCDVNQNLPSTTIVIDRKAVVKKYPGCTISSFSLTCAAGDFVKGSIDIKGVREETGSLNTSLPNFSIPSYKCISATFSVGGSIFDISSASLKIDNALEESPKTYSSGLYSGQPQHGKRSVTLDFEIPYSSAIEDFKLNYLTTENNTEVVLTFASSISDYKIEVIIPNLSINDVSANIGGTGILTASITGEALSVGDIEPIEVNITDKISTPYGE